MIVLAVDVEKELGTFKLAVRFEAASGVTALFGPNHVHAANLDGRLGAGWIVGNRA